MIYRVIGVHTIVSFVLNLLSAVWLLAIAYGLLRRFNIPSRVIAISLLIMVLIMPLPWLVFVGHEHTLQAALTMTFLLVAVALIEHGGSPTRTESVALALLAAALPVTRYEAFFLITPVVGLFLLRHQWRAAAITVVASAIPVLLAGGYFVSQGGQWVPISLFLKSPRAGGTEFGQVTSALQPFTDFGAFRGTFFAAYFGPSGAPVTLLLLLSAFTLVKRDSRRAGRWTARQAMIMIALIMGAANLWMVVSEIQMRYYGYLIAVAWCTAVVALWPIVSQVSLRREASRKIMARNLTLWLLILMMGVGVSYRAYRGWHLLAATTLSIYGQQVQMAKFVRAYYEDSHVLLNDIGAVTFQTNIHLLDYVGLGSPAVASARANGTWTDAYLDRLIAEQGIETAIIYDIWFGSVPATWVKVGTWTIPPGGLVGDRIVTFYAVQPGLACILIRHLQDFGPQLPGFVLQNGLYTDRVEIDRLCAA